MQKKHRTNGASERPVEDEIAHLRGLDLRGLRARWHSVFQRQAPTHLTRHLLFAVIAYRIQADRFGALDHATRQVLDQTVGKEAGPEMSSRLASFDQKRTELTPGTVLVREWDRQSQRVMVLTANVVRMRLQSRLPGKKVSTQGWVVESGSNWRPVTQS
jgi:hypothetical protein